MDLSGYVHPLISYQRWYTNSPPSGANPGADWFQVMASNDNGQSWIYIENTSTSDMSWRRNAFRVEDFLTPTAQMRFKFIASDSLRPEVNLSGGSLVEAAMDDFTLFDEYVPQSIGEANASSEWQVLPNLLTDGNTGLNISLPSGEWIENVSVSAINGQMVRKEQSFNAVGSMRYEVGNLDSGYYLLSVRGSKGKMVFPFVVIQP
jgi:hypothetical protein